MQSTSRPQLFLITPQALWVPSGFVLHVAVGFASLQPHTCANSAPQTFPAGHAEGQSTVSLPQPVGTPGPHANSQTLTGWHTHTLLSHWRSRFEPQPPHSYCPLQPSSTAPHLPLQTTSKSSREHESSAAPEEDELVLPLLDEDVVAASPEDELLLLLLPEGAPLEELEDAELEDDELDDVPPSSPADGPTSSVMPHAATAAAPTAALKTHLIDCVRIEKR